MTLAARMLYYEFINEFKKVGKNNDWVAFWNKNTEWTAKMLGTGESRKNGDFGLLGKIGQKYGYDIYAEWKDIDQIWSNFLSKPSNWNHAPWINDVIIEHENNINKFEYTILKFTEFSAPLKVGIFYPDDDENKYLDISKEIIKYYVSTYPGEIYLLIFGYLENEKIIIWKAHEIDWKGNSIQIDHIFKERANIDSE